MTHEPRPQWAPKVRPDLVRRLYEDEARGLLTDDLLDKVGWALWARCESILTVSRECARCPRCGAVFPTTWRVGGLPDDRNQCRPGCDWSVTNGAWHASWRHRDLRAGHAGPAFQAFVDTFPRLERPHEKMLAIDRLIHAFHQDLRRDDPNRSAANNLIEASHKQVVGLLDQLAASEMSAPERHQNRAEWQSRVEQMRHRRQGVPTNQQQHAPSHPR